MRSYLLTHASAEDSIVFGASFTIPGPNLSPGEIRKLWKDWSWRCSRAGWGAVWRLEVQLRGQAHWHCLISISRCMLRESMVRGRDMVVPVSALGAYGMWLCEESWHDALCRLGSREFDPPWEVGNMLITEVGTLMNLPGAGKHAAVVDIDRGEGAWKRYLQDHATKAKQEQIAEGFGRHWGVVGRKRFVEILPESVTDMDYRDYYRFLRMFQRLCTPQLRDKRPEEKRSPFGRRLGRRSCRGSWGRSVWFSRPETVEKLVTWATDHELSVSTS